jgi:hypothetical protein
MSAYGEFPVAPNRWLPAKAPLSDLDYTENVEEAITNPFTGVVDTLTGLSLSVKPSGAGELVVSDLTVDSTGFLISWFTSGGQAGRVYELRLVASAASNKTYVWTFGQVCEEPFQTSPLPPSPNPGFGDPITWTGEPVFPPAQQLPAYTVAATGTNQLTAAPVPLAQVLVNAGPNGGISLPAATSFNNAIMPVFNRTGGLITVYPHANDSIENNGVNVGVPIEDMSVAHFSVAQSGLLIMS